MDPLLTGAIAGSIVLVILLVALVSRLGRNRERAFARVEALRALVAESSQASLSPAIDAEPDDGWDLRIREDYYEADQDEFQPPAAAAAVRAARVVATTPQFVVRVPDAAGAIRGQVSFEHSGSEL
jgi:hypothetical protein